MKITNLLSVSTREEWRAWLKAHYRTESEVWLAYPRKGSGRPRVGYNDAVEEALCFGWIDGTVRGVDAEVFAQRFTPRRPGSPFSQPNRERLRRMIAAGKVIPGVLEKLAGVDLEHFDAPADVVAALRESPAAWESFQRFSEPYRRIRLAFVDAARGRPDEFAKRLKHLVRMTEKGCQFGFGIEPYF